METLLILAAVTACAVAGTVVLRLLARGRRAPLHLDSEHDVEDEALLLAEIGPSRSPIDRSGAVLDLDPIRVEDHAAPRLPRPDHREDDLR
ncbi:hypothetical protein FV226_06160 [Methylobacterium sp. WL12]|uniref:hypothetical protein n=1 Tax=Methylobacterium sp. WL12 TaxID=2603890 RepID=UPI0011CBB803|nr:hypothetical protein [Methylobacterium sp. WL12]TXM74654.1 hypothetical protein FV226_06160 [Methylobacterium sp. WL12]